MEIEKAKPKRKVVKKDIEKNDDSSELSLIQSIHEIRGKRVMMDFDLAKRYEVETKVLKQSVKRNIKRFPPDFMFQLTKEEFKILRSQIVTSRWGGTRYLPCAFTQEGVAMLSGLLNSDTAIDTNIKIMRAFVAVRNYFLDFAEFKQEFKEEIKEINARLDKNDMTFEAIFKLFDEYIRHKKELDKPRTQIGFKQSNNK